VTDTDPRAAVAPHPPSRVLFADRRGARCGGGTPLGLWHRYWRQDLRDPEVRSQVTSTAWRSLGGDRTAKGLEALAAFALIPPAAPGKRTPGPSDSNVPDQGQRLLRPAQRHRGSGQEWGPGPQSRVSCPLTPVSLPCSEAGHITVGHPEAGDACRGNGATSTPPASGAPVHPRCSQPSPRRVPGRR
jgi:hypothetical protein